MLKFYVLILHIPEIYIEPLCECDRDGFARIRANFEHQVNFHELLMQATKIKKLVREVKTHR